MNRPRPFVVLPFPRRGQEFVSARETTPSTNGPAERASTRLAGKRMKRAARFFQDINGEVAVTKLSWSAIAGKGSPLLAQDVEEGFFVFGVPSPQQVQVLLGVLFVV